jgi:hypothetical protein
MLYFGHNFLPTRKTAIKPPNQRIQPTASLAALARGG